MDRSYDDNKMFLKLDDLGQDMSGVYFLHFKDILLTDFEIHISCSALSSILKNTGFESPKKKKSGMVPTEESVRPILDSSFTSVPLPYE